MLETGQPITPLSGGEGEGCSAGDRPVLPAHQLLLPGMGKEREKYVKAFRFSGLSIFRLHSHLLSSEGVKLISFKLFIEIHNLVLPPFWPL